VRLKPHATSELTAKPVALWIYVRLKPYGTSELTAKPVALWILYG